MTAETAKAQIGSEQALQYTALPSSLLVPPFSKQPDFLLDNWKTNDKSDGVKKYDSYKYTTICYGISMEKWLLSRNSLRFCYHAKILIGIGLGRGYSGQAQITTRNVIPALESFQANWWGSIRTIRKDASRPNQGQVSSSRYRSYLSEHSFPFEV